MAFPTTGLTHFYKYDSNSNDNVGTSHGSDVNTPTYASGKISNAFTAVSASSQYSDLPNNVIPWGTNTVTVNVWVKFGSGAVNQSILMTARVGSGFLLYKDAGNTVSFGKPNVVGLDYSWTGADTNYHMWTFVADGSGMRTYLDGNSTPVVSNGNTASFTDPGGDTMTLAGYRSITLIQSGWYLNGQIDEMGIWSTALSTTDIATLYNSGAGITYPDPSGGSTRRGMALLGVGQ